MTRTQLAPQPGGPDGPDGPDGTEPEAETNGTAPPVGRLRRRLTTAAAVVAVALFTLWGIGGPLVGTSVLASTDEMVAHSPWLDDGVVAPTTRNTYLDDVYTSELPITILYKDSLGSGQPAQWDPYVSGGTPLGSTPTGALFSPLSLPFYVMPSWLASAYERLLEILCAVGGCFLFLRRLRLSRAAAVTGGLVFASSGFMISWLGFPHTRVAAFIPALFWTVERLIQQRRVRDAALVALPVAAMLLGGFPSVTGYALLTATAYTVVRVVGQYRGSWRAMAGILLRAAGGLAAGIGLTAVQLVPFVSFYRTFLIEGRGQGAAMHLEPSSLVTAIAPFALGTVNPNAPPEYFLPHNIVEGFSYLGMAALVLVVAAVAALPRLRRWLPPGVLVFTVVAALGWLVLIYFGGPPLALLQKLPGLRALFAGNFIGRSRSILGFLLAMLAAAGFELLLRRREPAGAETGPAETDPAETDPAAPAGGRASGREGARLVWAAAVWAAAAGGAAGLTWNARRATASAPPDTVSRLAQFDRQVLFAAVIGAVALACAGLLWRRRTDGRDGRGWPTTRFAAAAAVPLLIAVQAGYTAHGYYPYSPGDSFYPTTDTSRYLAANLGEQRYASTFLAMVRGTNSAYQLRSVNGHAFINASFAALVHAMPNNPIPYPTYIEFGPHLAQATSPVLDRLGTKYFLTAPADPVFGTQDDAVPDGSAVTLAPGQPVSLAVPGTGRLRAVGFTPAGPVPGSVAGRGTGSYVEVSVADAAGAQVATARRITNGMAAGVRFLVPVAADDVPAGARLRVVITLHAAAPLTVEASQGAVALDTVAGADDGLRLVHAGSSVIYQREHALPRIRWAGHAVVDTDQGSRVRRLATGAVPADTVLLSAPGPTGSGAAGQVAVRTDRTDEISTQVSASGAGYLVVADALQTGWAASVDGHPAPLVPADQGLVAVPVPAGQHVVTLHFSTAYHGVGNWLSAVSVVLVGGVLVGGWLWPRRRRRGDR
jgi:hypothetical protein